MSSKPLVWYELHFPRPLHPVSALGLLRQLAADQRSPALLLEARAVNGSVAYHLGVPRPQRAVVEAQLRHAISGLHVAPLNPGDRPPVGYAGRLRLSTRHRPLRLGDAEATCRALLGALASTRRGEQAVLQIVLGPRRIPMAVATGSSAAVTQSVWRTAWSGTDKQLDGEKRAALRDKVGDHGFACIARLGATAGSEKRARALLLGLLAAARTAESTGLQIRLSRSSPADVNRGKTPRWWKTRLNVSEVLCLSAWPMGDALPGLSPEHPKPLRAERAVKAHDRILVRATAPGDERPLGLSATDALQHLHVLGVTGAGKSTVLLNAITQDIAAGRGVVVIDPKGDLVADVLDRVPKERIGDIVVLDPSDTTSPVGMNPLAPQGGNSELAADGVLAVFKGLYPDAWGPRTQDVLHAAVLTLARRGDASLIMLPLLLTNDGFRRSLTANLNDPVALGPFWNWFESLSEPSRQQAIAPVLSRLRALLMRPNMRAVLGQIQPRFDISQVLTERKVLLVSLAKGSLGSDAASLLGSLIVARLWQTILARTNTPARERHPVMIYIDEVQDYMHLDTDIADVFAQSRSYGTGWTVAHQYLSQLPPLVRSGLMANARSRIIFDVSEEDARALARGIPELTSDDLTALGQYQVYASLLADGHRTEYASGATLPPPPTTRHATQIRSLSRRRYGRPLSDIEASFAALLDPDPAAGRLGRRPRRPQV